MIKKVTQKRPELFTLRADQEFWDALDILQVSQIPVRDRSSIVKELVIREAEKLRNKRELSK